MAAPQTQRDEFSYVLDALVALTAGVEFELKLFDPDSGKQRDLLPDEAPEFGTVAKPQGATQNGIHPVLQLEAAASMREANAGPVGFRAGAIRSLVTHKLKQARKDLGRRGIIGVLSGLSIASDQLTQTTPQERYWTFEAHDPWGMANGKNASSLQVTIGSFRDATTAVPVLGLVGNSIHLYTALFASTPFRRKSYVDEPDPVNNPVITRGFNSERSIVWAEMGTERGAPVVRTVQEYDDQRAANLRNNRYDPTDLTELSRDHPRLRLKRVPSMNDPALEVFAIEFRMFDPPPTRDEAELAVILSGAEVLYGLTRLQKYGTEARQTPAELRELAFKRAAAYGMRGHLFEAGTPNERKAWDALWSRLSTTMPLLDEVDAGLRRRAEKTLALMQEIGNPSERMMKALAWYRDKHAGTSDVSPDPHVLTEPETLFVSMFTYAQQLHGLTRDQESLYQQADLWTERIGEPWVHYELVAPTPVLITEDPFTIGHAL